MDKRIGTALILIEKKDNVEHLNSIISNHSSIIIGRLGVPKPEQNYNIISLLLEGSTDQIGSLTGQIGKLKGIKVKSVVIRNKE